MSDFKCESLSTAIAMVCTFYLTLVISVPLQAEEKSAKTATEEGKQPVKRIYLLGQSPDGHPLYTHEYMAGQHILAFMLKPYDDFQVIIENADEPWKQGPELLDQADCVVLFVSQGAKWVQQDEHRLKAFQELAKRKGGLVVLHWGMGCKEAKYIQHFVDLFGGCHGGPDRRYKVVNSVLRPVLNDKKEKHPVTNGLQPVKVKEEFYYQLKFPANTKGHSAVLETEIEGKRYPVSWAWERPDGGRSFGFSGLHFHNNWQQETYRRAVLQAVLWTLNKELPSQGVSVEVPARLLKLKPQNKPKAKVNSN